MILQILKKEQFNCDISKKELIITIEELKVSIYIKRLMYDWLGFDNNLIGSYDY